MKTRENNLWSWLSGARVTFGRSIDLERVENSIGAGHPDVRGMLRGRHFYIELKTVARPARSSTLISVGLRKEQVDWADGYMAAGGKACFLLVQVGSGHSARRYLIDSEHWRFLFDEKVGETWLDKNSYVASTDRPESVCTVAAEW